MDHPHTHSANTARVNGAFFVAVTWLATSITKDHGLKAVESLGITIISLLFNCVGLALAGYGFDNGMKAITAYFWTVVVGVLSGFGLYHW